MEIVHKYPKLLLLCITTLAAYVLYAMGGLDWLHDTRGSSEYLAVFIGGLLFTFGFTAPFGIGVFLEVGHAVDPVFGALLGGVGALIGDLVIFQIMRFEMFHEELHHLRSSAVVRWAHKKLHHEDFPEKLRQYLLWSFAGLIIASPLPDEFGVALVSSLTDIKQKTFAILSFVCNTAGIYAMLALGAVIG